MTALSPQEQLEQTAQHIEDHLPDEMQQEGPRREIASGASFQQGQAALSPAAPTTLMDLFARMDVNKDKGLSREEVIGHLKAIKMRGGLLGIIHSSIATKMMESLDTNQDELVTWGEFQSIATELIPEDLFEEDGSIRMDMLKDQFATFDRDGDGNVTREEMEKSIEELLPEGTSNAGIIAEVTARFVQDALDSDGRKGLSQDEILEGAEAVSALRAAAHEDGGG